jgi:hypothetical protein
MIHRWHRFLGGPVVRGRFFEESFPAISWEKVAIGWAFLGFLPEGSRSWVKSADRIPPLGTRAAMQGFVQDG